jgi:hypothetical protein
MIVVLHLVEENCNSNLMAETPRSVETYLAVQDLP